VVAFVKCEYVLQGKCPLILIDVSFTVPYSCNLNVGYLPVTIITCKVLVELIRNKNHEHGNIFFLEHEKNSVGKRKTVLSVLYQEDKKRPKHGIDRENPCPPAPYH
jgi:hypothetical protein